jgi:hypothetical protein
VRARRLVPARKVLANCSKQKDQRRSQSRSHPMTNVLTSHTARPVATTSYVSFGNAGCSRPGRHNGLLVCRQQHNLLSDSAVNRHFGFSVRVRYCRFWLPQLRTAFLISDCFNDGPESAAKSISSVVTRKTSSDCFPNEIVIGTSAASRPKPINTRPMRRRLCRASKIYHCRCK